MRWRLISGLGFGCLHLQVTCMISGPLPLTRPETVIPSPNSKESRKYGGAQGHGHLPLGSFRKVPRGNL